MDFLEKALTLFSVNEIAESLNVVNGTIKRWMQLKNVPPAYRFDLMKLTNTEINYADFSHKEKDQFFTNADTAKYCFEKVQEIITPLENLNEYFYIEPSAGEGSFLNLLPNDRRLGLDIEPKNNEIIYGDYLTWSPITEKNIIIGNPPFGLRGHLALKFINHSYKFADFVCFILPQLFESDGKGSPRKRVSGFNLLHSEKLKTGFYYPGGKTVVVNCIFQIWSKNHKNLDYEIKKTMSETVKIYSLSDGGSSSTTRNKKMFNSCDAYIPSTCFGKEKMKYYTAFADLPGKKGYGIVFFKDKKQNLEKFKKIVWCDVAYLSTNSAYNIRTSQIASQFV